MKLIEKIQKLMNKNKLVNRIILVPTLLYMVPLCLLSYPICKLIPKYKLYCPPTFINYLKEMWWAIKTDWNWTEK